jgi:hypothetical protein
MADASMESGSEDFSIPSIMLEERLRNCPLLHEKTHAALYHVLFETVAFHPPPA